MENSKKEQGSGDELLLCRQLQGAKQFIIEILETSSPSRPIDFRPPAPPEPPVPNNNAFRMQMANFMSVEAAEREANGEARAQKTRSSDFWDMLSGELKEDRDVAFAAFVGEHARLEDLPTGLHEDEDFFLDAVKKNFRLWFRIPPRFQVDPEFLKFLSIRTDHMAAVAFEKVPELRDSHQVWEHQLIPRFVNKDYGDWDKVLDDFRKGLDESDGSKGCSLLHAPQSIRADHNLMIKACSERTAELGRVDKSLLMNQDFLQRVLVEKPLGLMFLPQEVLLAFPDLVENFLPKFMEADVDPPHCFCAEELAGVLGPEFLNRPSFPKAWFCSGGIFLPDQFPEAWKDREDIFLWIAEHCNAASNQFEHHATDLLKGNLEFMISATELDANIYAMASDTIKENYELVVRHVSSRRHARRYVQQDDSAEWQDEVEKLYTRLLDEFQTYKRFFAFFLYPLSDTESTMRQQSHVSLLKQGSDTTLVYKKLVAEYLGIPTARKFKFHLSALYNLAQLLDSEFL